MDVKKIDKRRIKKVHGDDEISIYSALVYSVGLKRKVKLCFVEFYNENNEVALTKLFFSTNEQRSGQQILAYYKARFQMEFNFRDAKQYTGLEN